MLVELCPVTGSTLLQAVGYREVYKHCIVIPHALPSKTFSIKMKLTLVSQRPVGVLA